MSATARQRDVLARVVRFRHDRGRNPSLEELAGIMFVADRSTAHSMVRRLRAKRLITPRGAVDLTPAGIKALADAELPSFRASTRRIKRLIREGQRDA